MVISPPLRTALAYALMGAAGLMVPAHALAEQPGQVHPVPARPPSVRAVRPQQEHLAQWMDRHRSLTLEQQQQALEREPGFRDYPAQTQQRLRERLTQLNNMPPEQRRRLLERTEAMERLTVPQRQQVRGAMQQLSSLPVERRRLVARAFRDIREMPPAQRESVLDSDKFRGQFSDQERSTLTNLLAVEPYLPQPKPNDTP